MAAAKVKKAEKGGGGAHGHTRARLAYLNKAAIYLQSHQPHQEPAGTVSTKGAESQTIPADDDGNDTQKADRKILRACIPRHYINQMRGVALKTQQRLSIETKRSFCKRCDLLLIPGVTCTEEVENESKDPSKKPWADMMVVRCKACETVKRFPQNQTKRSAKLAVRKQERKEKNEKDVQMKEGNGGS